MILLHGTTLARAKKILKGGPDPHFSEPGGEAADSGFSMTVQNGPFYFGEPEDYARSKAQEFPHEGGPAILAVDVPEDIVQKAANEWFPIRQGLVQFDFGNGLEELIAVWPRLAKEIRCVN